ncbi:ribulokinase [Sinomicrobium weinanense]|uniref:Ribulokinase n=1 Tax=Sinomicrobium weinanense TaxID=2842200 RepID=A0A926JSA8_9FLAO|nr:ribulokinase [Sinomicrobium weinanense]MBC9796353.1 ribulokinase [Sinomicrobium weinanense]MBU3122445.1 ribulokinase [Sinomicrobium weinanense]
MKQYVVGLDFGTDSVRAVLVDTSTGRTLESEVHWYSRWKEGKYCNARENRFRQHPLDHIEGMETTVKKVVQRSGVPPEAVKGICIDTTGSSPVPIDSSGTALALTPGFEENPNAMMVLWKDHTSIAEAAEINHLAKNWGGIDYTRYIGGVYSSEWFWAKILHIAREDRTVKEAAWSWMEHCDLMTYILTGKKDPKTFKCSRCAAGHKAMWHESWGGLPEDGFLSRLDPYLVTVKENLYTDTFTSDMVAGTLSRDWSEKLGLTEHTIVAVGTFDAHAGAVGAGAEAFALVRVMGTSTCDIMVAPKEIIGNNAVKGICGQVDGSVVPGWIGLEAGQSAFGDLLAWFREVLAWPLENLLNDTILLSEETRQQLREELKSRIIPELSAQAEKIPAEESVPLALDWINGRRTPDADQALKSAITGLNLGTRAPHIFRALVEAICFGAKKIVERFEEEGVEIRSVVGIGGVAKKAPFVMQTLADVLDRPIRIAVSDQAPALGAAIYAAVAAGIYPTVEEAVKAMGSPMETTYEPREAPVGFYREKYARYKELAAFVEKDIHKKNPLKATSDV